MMNGSERANTVAGGERESERAQLVSEDEETSSFFSSCAEESSPGGPHRSAEGLRRRHMDSIFITTWTRDPERPHGARSDLESCPPVIEAFA